LWIGEAQASVADFDLATTRRDADGPDIGRRQILVVVGADFLDVNEGRDRVSGQAPRIERNQPFPRKKPQASIRRFGDSWAERSFVKAWTDSIRGVEHAGCE